MKLFFVFGFLWFIWFASGVVREAKQEFPANGKLDPIVCAFMFLMLVLMEP